MVEANGRFLNLGPALSEAQRQSVYLECAKARKKAQKK
jgi:hypothetical protein